MIRRTLIAAKIVAAFAALFVLAMFDPYTRADLGTGLNWED